MRKQAAAGRRGATRRRPTVQYTVRDVPAHVDRALRRKALEEGKSLNQLLRDALTREAGGDTGPAVLHHDLDDLAGTWEDDPEFDRVIAEQDRVDEAMWQ
jgi:hypothetical protein